MAYPPPVSSGNVQRINGHASQAPIVTDTPVVSHVGNVHLLKNVFCTWCYLQIGWKTVNTLSGPPTPLLAMVFTDVQTYLANSHDTARLSSYTLKAFPTEKTACNTNTRSALTENVQGWRFMATSYHSGPSAAFWDHGKFLWMTVKMLYRKIRAHVSKYLFKNKYVF